MQNDGTAAALCEFTFSYQGTVLNLNDREVTGLNVVPVTATFGSQSTTSGNHPNRVWDGRPLVSAGSPATRWVSGTGIDALTTPFEITFTNGEVTVDSYNFCTETESSTSGRTPVSWMLYGKKASVGAEWELIDVRSNAALNFGNNTYQAGFTIPETITPAINLFRVQAIAGQGTTAIVRNDDPQGVKLEWDATLGTTTISPPGNPVALSGSAFFNPPDNATTTYTFASTLNAQTVNRTAIVRSVAGGTSSYRYLRFKATKLRNGTATGLVQISEFGFLNNGSAVAVNSVTNPGGNNPANEGVGNLIDGVNTNKWLDVNNGYAIFDLGEPNPPFDENQVTHYYWVTGNDATERDPLQWTLEGTNDDPSGSPTWALVENVNFDYPVTTTRNVTIATLPLPGASLAPSITYFTATPNKAYEGSPITLNWEATGAATVSIDHGVGTVDAQGTTVVNPPVGLTTYTLTANSVGNVATTLGTLTVNVLAGAAPVGINFADFSGNNDAFNLRGSASFTGGRMQLTPDLLSQQGEVWHIVKQPVAEGFEATFGLSMTHAAGQPADGISFNVHNHPLGANAPSTGEGGMTSNALSVCFIAYGGTAPDASRVQVKTGNVVLQTASLSNTPGITYKGITNYAYPTMTGMPGAEPFRVRVVYTPGDGELTDSLVDVYVNDVAVLENVVVDLEGVDAIDANGDSYVGFAGRTGGLSQLNQITYFNMRYGDFSALPTFGMVKAFKNTMFPNAPTWDLVWDSDWDNTYVVQTSDNLIDWVDFEFPYQGEDGQIGHRYTIDAAETRRFYRVKEVLPGE